MDQGRNSKKVAFVLGTARDNGNTRILLDRLDPNGCAELIDLTSKDIGYYDYQHDNSQDEFLAVAESLLAFQTIVFCTPVYWYAMSAQLKTFFDRLTDLLQIRKDIGRSLAGRDTWLVATGTGDALPVGFEVPFARTSKYFDMNYRGALYIQIRDDFSIPPETMECIRKFASQIFHTS